MDTRLPADLNAEPITARTARFLRHYIRHRGWAQAVIVVAGRATPAKVYEVHKVRGESRWLAYDLVGKEYLCVGYIPS